MNFFSFLYQSYFHYYLKKNSFYIEPIDQLKQVPEKIFIISNTALGDTLLSTPLMQSLKLSFPSAKLVVLIHKNYIPLFENCSFIDKIIPFYGSYHRFMATLREIRKEKITLTLIAHGNSPLDMMFAIMGGSRFILKHPTKSHLKKYLSYDFVKKEQHTIEDRLDLARMIGACHLTTEMNIGELKNHLSESKILKLLPNTCEYIGFQIGAADNYKMWPIAHFISLAQLILSQTNTKIVITGNSSESLLAQAIIRECGNERVINTCGEMTIAELPYLLSRLKVLVTNDTGTMHLAIAIKTPTISLFSPTSSFGIGPYQDQQLHTVIQKNGDYIQHLPKKERSDEAMKLITVNEVAHTLGLTIC